MGDSQKFTITQLDAKTDSQINLAQLRELIDENARLRTDHLVLTQGLLVSARYAPPYGRIHE